MEKLHKRAPRSINWCKTTMVLLWIIIVMLGPVDGAHDDVTIRTDLHFLKQDENVDSINVISSVLDTTATVLSQIPRKPRILCLHGGNSNAVELKTSIDAWPESITRKMDLVFINATFPNMNGGFNWFDVNTYDNLEECYTYIEDRMIELGPFDGMLGYSQGAVVAAAAPGLQHKGHCFKNVGKIEQVVVISGAILGGILFPLPNLVQEVFYPPINIPSLHIFGEDDMARFTQPELVKKYVDPLVIYHHGGHVVPKLDEEGLKIFFEFLKRINATV